METSTSKERILYAAMQIVAQKGIHGTKMEEIAKVAGINKAMVYYYFSNKNNLYVELLKTMFTDMYRDTLNRITEDTSQGKSHAEIISNCIRYSFECYNNNPDYTRIMIDAISNGMDDIPKALELVYQTSNPSPTSQVLSTIQDGIDNKVFRDVDPIHTMISITGVTFIYFLSRNIIRFFGMNIENEEEFIQNRITSVTDLIMNGLLRK